MTDYSPGRAIAGDSDRVHPARGRWRKSSFSGSNGDCIEVASLAGGHVGVRDSKKTSGPCLLFSPDVWTAFVNDIRHTNRKGRNLILLQLDGRLPSPTRPARTIPHLAKRQRSTPSFQHKILISTRYGLGKWLCRRAKTNASESRGRDTPEQVTARA